METKIYENATLVCKLQDETFENETKYRNGALSECEDGKFLFEETSNTHAHKVNTRLYDGNIMSLIRDKQGNCRFHSRQMNEAMLHDIGLLKRTVINDIDKALSRLN